MPVRKPRRKTQSTDAELAVGALERPDPLDLEGIDNAATFIDLPQSENGRFTGELCSRCSRGAVGECRACGLPLCASCLARPRQTN
jgi:hypothetical protein